MSSIFNMKLKNFSPKRVHKKKGFFFSWTCLCQKKIIKICARNNLPQQYKIPLYNLKEILKKYLNKSIRKKGFLWPSLHMFRYIEYTLDEYSFICFQCFDDLLISKFHETFQIIFLIVLFDPMIF